MVYTPKGNIVGVPINNMKVPLDGAQSSFLGLFAMPGSYTLELNKHENGARVELPQTLFFDASTSTGAVTLVFAGSQQTLVLPAQSQGYIPILTPDEPTLTISGSGAGSIGLSFISVPLPADIWSVAPGGASTVTANQGLPAVVANAWPVELAQGGALNSPTNPIFVENTAAEADPTYSPSASPPVSNVGAATDLQLIGGEVYNITGAAAGSQLPFQLTATGQLIVTGAVSEANLEAGTALTGVGAVAAPTRAYIFGGLFEAYGSYTAPTAGQVATVGITVNRELLVSDHAAEASLVTLAAAVTASGAAASASGIAVQGEYRSAPLALTTGQGAIPNLDVTGNLQATEMGVVAIAPTELTAGTVTPALATPYGARIVDTESLTPTYAAAIDIALPSAFAGDFLYIQGSASKTIRIKKIGICLNSASGAAAIEAIKRIGGSYTGGTTAAVPVVRYDSLDPAGTASVVSSTTAFTTVATIAGAIRATEILGTAPAFDEWGFAQTAKSVVLRGITEFVALNVANSLGASTGIYAYFEWTEV